MPAKNDITGDALRSRSASADYLSNYDRIFGVGCNHPEHNIPDHIDGDTMHRCPECGATVTVHI